MRAASVHEGSKSKKQARAIASSLETSERGASNPNLSMASTDRTASNVVLLKELSERGTVELPPAVAGSSHAPLAYLTADFDHSDNYIITHAAEQSGPIQVFSIEYAEDPSADALQAGRLVGSFLLPPGAFVKQILFAEREDRLLVVSHDLVVRVPPQHQGIHGEPGLHGCISASGKAPTPACLFVECLVGRTKRTHSPIYAFISAGLPRLYPFLSHSSKCSCTVDQVING